MSQKIVKTKGIMGLETKIMALQERIAALEHISLKLTRKKRQYTDEQRAAIKARLLAGQESARKRRETEAQSEIIDKPKPPRNEKPTKVIKAGKAQKTNHMILPELS